MFVIAIITIIVNSCFAGYIIGEGFNHHHTSNIMFGIILIIISLLLNGAMLFGRKFNCY